METSLRETYQSARLILRENHRNQPIGCAITRVMQTLGLLTGLLIVFSMGAMSDNCSGMQEPPHDYMADITAKARSVPEGERAWPLYREALIVLYRDMRELGGDFYIDTPDGEMWDQTVEYVETHQKEIALIRKAAAMPGLGFIADHSISEDDQKIWPEAYSDELDEPDEPSSYLEDSVVTALVPHIGYMRQMSKMLAADVRMGMEAGDSDRVLSDIQAMFGIAAHSRETPIMICDLVSVAVSSLAFETLGEVLQIHPALLSDWQLRLLSNEMHAMTEGEESLLAVRVEGERIAILDMIQRVYTDEYEGNWHLSPRGIETLRDFGLIEKDVPPEKVLMDMSWDLPSPMSGVIPGTSEELEAECHRLMDMVEAEAAIPLWKRPEQSVSDQRRELYRDEKWRKKYFLVNLMMPGLLRASLSSELVVIKRNAMMTAIALVLYRRGHDGQYPPNLKVLVPQYLKTIPLDRFNGKPMGYHVQDDGSVILYCVGVDLDDDGGREADSEIEVRYRSDRWLHPSEVAEYKEEDEQAGTPGAKRKLADGDILLWESRQPGY